MNISGLNALDPRVAATEKFISDKKIPPDQVPAFLMQMGADPRLAGLVMRFQRLKNASAQGGGQAQKPQTTVAQDVEAQQRGIAAPTAPVQGRDQGIAALPAPVVDRAKFAGGGIVAFQEGGNEGLGDADPNQEVESEFRYLGRLKQQAFARGDYAEVDKIQKSIDAAFAGTKARARQQIVSSVERPIDAARQYFGMGKYAAGNVPAPVTAQAAPVEAPSAAGRKRDWARAKQQNRNTPEGRRPIPDLFVLGDTDKAPVGALLGAKTGAGQINEGIKILRNQVNELKNLKPEDREARYRAAGIEDMTPKQLAKIEERISKLSGDKKRDAYMALAQAGFKMAAAASRPGASVLGAFGEGASEGAKMMADINKEYRGLQSDLEDKVMSLQRYQQERKEGRIDRDIEFERDLAKEIRSSELKMAELAEDARRFDVSTDLQRQQLAQQAEASRRGEDPIRQLKRAYLSTKDPRKREQILAEMVKLNEVDTRAFIEQLKAENMLKRDEAKNAFGGLGGIGGVSDIVSQADAIVGR